MKAQTWLKQNKSKLIESIRAGALHSQIHGDFSANDTKKIDEILETVTVQGETLDDNVDGEEVMKAYTSICVHRLDEYTIRDIIDNASHEEIDFNVHDNCMDNSDELFKLFIKKLYTNGNNFIIMPPMHISILQSSPSYRFFPAETGSFRGAGFTMLVGTIDDDSNDVPIYSYISGDGDKTIIGYKDSDSGKIIATVYTVNNISF